ncbi:MAG: hypothetical protein ACRDFT_01615 [bacterium]
MTAVAAGVAGLILLLAAWRLRVGFSRFRARFRSHLAACPDIEWRTDTVTGMLCTVSGVPFEVDLLETYIFHLRHREPERDAFDRVVDGLRHRVPPVTPAPFPLVQDRILPMIKREHDLVLSRGYRPQHHPVRSPFAGDLVVAYVIEGQFQMTVITEGMRSAWGLGMDELHTLAVANLRRKTAHLLDELGGPQTEYIALDGFDAARLLVADLLVPPGITDPVVAIPHAHACLIAPAGDAPALAARAAAMHEAAEFPLTALLFALTPDGPVPRPFDRTQGLRPGGTAGSSEGQSKTGR